MQISAYSENLRDREACAILPETRHPETDMDGYDIPSGEDPVTASPGRVTLRDIAEAVGVSISTASRALNGAPGISDAVRSRVQSAAERLNYAGASVALSTVTVLFDVHLTESGAGEFMHAVQRGIERRTRELGVSLSMKLVGPSGMARLEPDDETAGYLLLSMQPEALIQLLSERAIPAVIVNGREPLMRLDAVAPANRTGGYLGDSLLAVPGAVLAMLCVGLGVGGLNGYSVVRLNMPPFIVTLATRMFFAGAAIWYVTFHSTSSSIANLPRSFTNFATGSLAGIPYTVIVAGLIAIFAHLLLARTEFGRWVYAVGANPKAARISGIPVERTILCAFLISGACASVAAIMYSSRMQTGSPIVGENILLDVIGAVVIGGTSLFGGKGKIIWTVFGVLFLLLIDTSMKLLGASLFAIFIIKGGVILAAAMMDTFRNRILVGR
jgi:ribose/xylose/arabinose/galactoside ABC-type transport system permease subunit